MHRVCRRMGKRGCAREKKWHLKILAHLVIIKRHDYAVAAHVLDPLCFCDATAGPPIEIHSLLRRGRRAGG